MGLTGGNFAKPNFINNKISGAPKFVSGAYAQPNPGFGVAT
jgi:hypothetical protein